MIKSFLVLSTLVSAQAFAAAKNLEPRDCGNYLVAEAKFNDEDLRAPSAILVLVKNIFAGTYDIGLAASAGSRPFYQKVLSEHFADDLAAGIALPPFTSLSFKGLTMTDEEFDSSFKKRRDYESVAELSSSLSPAEAALASDGSKANVILIFKSRSGEYLAPTASMDEDRDHHEIRFAAGSRWRVMKTVPGSAAFRSPHVVFLVEDPNVK